MNLRYDRYQGLNLFKSDPNAELPPAIQFGGSFETIAETGKCWDDSEVSDEEMDALIEAQNRMSGFGSSTYQPGSSIRFFR